MKIRAATAADEDAVLGLIEELFEPPGARPKDYTPERARAGLRYILESADADVLLAEEGGRVQGLATVYRTFPALRYGWRCWLQDLVVTSDERSKGIGGALLYEALEWARRHECTHLMLDSSHGRKDSHRFYLKQGMSQESLTFKRLLAR